MNMLTLGDRKFLLHVMKMFNIKRLNVGWSDSQKKWPDIWCYPTKRPPVIVVTKEWARQGKDERRKRLVHEMLHLIGMEHDETIRYSTIPSQDFYSAKIYNILKGI